MTSDEVLGEELGGDMLDVANVGDTGDRLVESVPERDLYSALLRSCAAAAWRARSRAGHLHTAGALERQLGANPVIALDPFSFSFASTFLPCAFSSLTVVMRAASWRSRLGFASETDALHPRSAY